MEGEGTYGRSSLGQEELGINRTTNVYQSSLWSK